MRIVCYLAESAVPRNKVLSPLGLVGHSLDRALHRTLSGLVPAGSGKNPSDPVLLTSQNILRSRWEYLDGGRRWDIDDAWTEIRISSAATRCVLPQKRPISTVFFHSCFLFPGVRLIIVTVISTLNLIHSKNPNPVPHCLHLNLRRIHTQPTRPTLRVHLAL